MKQNRRTFLRNSALASGAITFQSLAGQAQSTPASASWPANAEIQSGGGALVRQQFKSPAKKYRPLARWWWPGNFVEDAELRREIDVLDKAGLAGAEIQSFFKGFDLKDFSEAQRQEIESYATPSFFRHVGVAVEEARSRGMFIDYTFGSGWPFGGGMAITPELASIELRSTHLSVQGPAKLDERLHIPSVTDGDPLHGADRLEGLPEGWAERMKKRTKVVAVVAVRGEDARWNGNIGGGRDWMLAETGTLERDTAIDLTAQMQPDGTLHWDVPAGTWQLFVFCSVPTAQRVNAGAGPGPQLVMDHLSYAAFQAQAKRVGGDAIPFIGEYFGNGLRAIFCDSLEVGANLFWSDDFLPEFRSRRRYDLLPYLPILKVRTNAEPYDKFVGLPVFDIPEIGDQVRHDYRLTVSDLMIERMYEQFNQWAHDHKLLSRTQAHGSPTDVLRVYGEANIPETEDLYDDGGYDFLKMAPSSANVYGRAIVGSESFVWSNALYETTPEKMKRAADELLTAGVNAIVYHGFAYDLPGVPAPGWHPFSGFGDGNYSSQLNEMNPFWPYLAQLNAYITRVQFISQVGTTVSSAALYMNDIAHGAEDVPPTPQLNQTMMDAGYNYDHINVESILASAVRDKMLVTTGGARYRVLVFPALDAMDAQLAEKLVTFAAAGLPILFAEQAPTRASGFLDGAKGTQRVRDAMRGLRNFRQVCFCEDVDTAINALRSGVHPDIRFHSRALPFIQKRVGKLNAYFLRNNSDIAEHLNAEFEAEGAAELWDPWTGEITAIAGERRAGDWVTIELDLQPLSSALIVLDPEDAGRPAMNATAPRSLKRSEEIGAGGWELKVTGLVPSGKTATIQRDLPKLIDWSLDSGLRGMSGRGVYTTRFTAPAMVTGGRLILDLGGVKDVAEVAVNGKPVATLLLRPYRTDITDFVQPGENQLEVSVTNSLFNSMALREPRTFRPGPTDNPDGLMSAGLIGPVQVKVME